MPKRIPDKTREEIIRLYNNGSGQSPAEISRQTGVSYSSVYGWTRVRQRINPETKQQFESRSQLMDYKVRQRVNPETGQPFESLSQYEKYMVRKRINQKTKQPFESRGQYEEYTVKQRINKKTKQPFESRSQSEEDMVRKRINSETVQQFESRSQYEKYTARQRVNRPENQGLSRLITRRLEELGRNQSWLADEIGVTRQTVWSYVKGRSTPKDDLLKRLYSSLDVPYETLDDLLEAL